MRIRRRRNGDLCAPVGGGGAIIRGSRLGGAQIPGQRIGGGRCPGDRPMRSRRGRKGQVVRIEPIDG